MAILNYTTTIDPLKTIGEIQAILAKHGVTTYKQRRAKQTQCPSCHKRYALETIYGGASVVPIGVVCKFCDWSNLIKSNNRHD